MGRFDNFETLAERTLHFSFRVRTTGEFAMDLLAGGPTLAPPFRKRIDASDATARRLLGHAAEITRLATVYDALQDKAASVLQVRGNGRVRVL